MVELDAAGRIPQQAARHVEGSRQHHHLLQLELLALLARLVGDAGHQRAHGVGVLGAGRRLRNLRLRNAQQLGKGQGLLVGLFVAQPQRAGRVFAAGLEGRAAVELDVAHADVLAERQHGVGAGGVVARAGVERAVAFVGFLLRGGGLAAVGRRHRAATAEGGLGHAAGVEAARDGAIGPDVHQAVDGLARAVGQGARQRGGHGLLQFVLAALGLRLQAGERGHGGQRGRRDAGVLVHGGVLAWGAARLRD